MNAGDCKKKCIIKCVIGILVFSGLVWGAFEFHLSRTMKKAEAALNKGFSTLAAEDLEFHRSCLVSSEKGCRLLLSSYFGARMSQRLDWAAQACLNSGIEIPESYIGLSAARDMEGRPQEAIQILAGVTEKFKDIPDIFYRLAQILARVENHEAAMNAYIQTIQRAPNNGQIALEALDYFSRLKAWAKAKPIADQLKGVQTDNPAVKLLIARVFKNNGDAADAKAMVDQATALLAQAPNKAQIEQSFSDVLGTSKK